MSSSSNITSAYTSTSAQRLHPRRIGPPPPRDLNKPAKGKKPAPGTARDGQAGGSASDVGFPRMGALTALRQEMQAWRDDPLAHSRDPPTVVMGPMAEAHFIPPPALAAEKESAAKLLSKVEAEMIGGECEETELTAATERKQKAQQALDNAEEAFAADYEARRVVWDEVQHLQTENLAIRAKVKANNQADASALLEALAAQGAARPSNLIDAGEQLSAYTVGDGFQHRDPPPLLPAPTSAAYLPPPELKQQYDDINGELTALEGKKPRPKSEIESAEAKKKAVMAALKEAREDWVKKKKLTDEEYEMYRMSHRVAASLRDDWVRNHPPPPPPPSAPSAGPSSAALLKKGPPPPPQQRQQQQQSASIVLSIQDELKLRQVGIGMSTPFASSIQELRGAYDAHLAELRRSHDLALKLQGWELGGGPVPTSIYPGGPGSLTEDMTSGEKLEGGD